MFYNNVEGKQMIVGDSLCFQLNDTGLCNQNKWIFTQTRSRVASYTCKFVRLCKTLLICLNFDIELTLNVECNVLAFCTDKLRRNISFKIYIYMYVFLFKHDSKLNFTKSQDG